MIEVGPAVVVAVGRRVLSRINVLIFENGPLEIFPPDRFTKDFDIGFVETAVLNGICHGS